MRRVEKSGTVFFEPEAFEPFPNVRAAITTRHGGVSLPPFDSLNLSTSVGDDPSAVQENYRRVHQALALDLRTTVDARQAQAGDVAIITGQHRGTRINQVDALATNVPGIPLMLRFADCVPIFFYDPFHRAIAVAHAGWRGTVAKVVANTVHAMKEAFGTHAEDIRSCVGPSIGPCCYNIGGDVRVRVQEAFAAADDLLITRSDSVSLDLWEANASILRDLGVGEIEIAGMCTSDNTGDLYSWRKENARTGRFAAVIALYE